MFFSSVDDRRHNITYCYEILSPSRDASHDNPEPILPTPLPPHQHERGYDARCGLCEYLQEIARGMGR
jgi:hypothetical protein